MKNILNNISSNIIKCNELAGPSDFDVDKANNRNLRLISLIQKFRDDFNKKCKINDSKGAVILLCPYNFIGRSQGGAIRTNNVISVIRYHYPVVSISYTWMDSLNKFKLTQVADNWLHIDIYHEGSLGGWVKSGDFHYINWYTPEMLQIIREVASRLKIRRLWLEYSFMGLYRHIGHEYHIPVTIDLHNIEWQLAQELTKDKKNPYLEPFGNWEVCKIAEEELIRQELNIIVTTERDAEYCRKLRQNNQGIHNVFIAPNIISTKKVSSLALSSLEHLNFIFVGDCRYAPNLEGLQWFLGLLNKIDKSILKTLGFHLKIIGKGSENLVLDNELNEFITILGFVDDLQNHYATTSVSLIPLQSGGGSRLKAYEAIEFGKFIFTTEKGTEGINFDSLNDYVFKFSNEKNFIEGAKAIHSLIKNCNLEVLREKYSSWYTNEQNAFRTAIEKAL